MSSQTVLAKKRRGPAPTGKGQQVVVRLQPDLLTFIDALCQRHDPPLSRPEAIRQALDALRMAEFRRSKGYLPAAEDGAN